jgi:hypothetical protein
MARKSKSKQSQSTSDTAPAAIPQRRLAYDRRETGQLLGGLSVPSIIRLEKAGVLKPFTYRPGGKVHHGHDHLQHVIKTRSE